MSKIYVRNPIAHFVATEGGVYLEPRAQWHIRDDRGRRKYLTEQERMRFLAAADRARPDIRALCYVMAYTGCRVSEALALTADRLEPDSATITFRTLKRRRLSYRAVPVPTRLVEMLQALPLRGGRSVLDDAPVNGLAAYQAASLRKCHPRPDGMLSRATPRIRHARGCPIRTAQFDPAVDGSCIPDDDRHLLGRGWRGGAAVCRKDVVAAEAGPSLPCPEHH